MHREQLRRLTERVAEKGLTLVPLSMHFTHGRVKVVLGLARGKHLHDKRETLRRREIDRGCTAGGSR